MALQFPLDRDAVLLSLKAERLTPRQRQLCLLLSNLAVARRDNDWLASQLGTAPGTVKLHMHKLYRKTGLDRAGLALLGLLMRSSGAAQSA
jgi:DNA-binding CsgD family transcriptional regulator